MGKNTCCKKLHPTLPSLVISSTTVGISTAGVALHVSVFITITSKNIYTSSCRAKVLFVFLLL